ncbi:hypothetical protein V1512DRAFT_106510 [Lipomyces arxii]|uniref:mitochondrial 37S ribosomal protein uS4m n=1 Tax=Lipomyces arxii TaxID=56418 RepID=UPI0034CFBA35
MTKKPSVPPRSLVRGLVRSSWHKQNLYNLFKKEYYERSATLYQQKWEAKKETRAYHGDHLSERQWQGIFNRKLVGAEQLRRHDVGSHEPLPMALQLYAPLERRLDVAIFRAMFASSPKQARMLVNAGKVKVNGEKMKHAFYPLRPGDMFSVDPEFVLASVGRNKPTKELSDKVDEAQRDEFEKFITRCKASPKEMFDRKFAPSIKVDGEWDPMVLYRQIRSLAVERLSAQAKELREAEHTEEELVQTGKDVCAEHQAQYAVDGSVESGDEKMTELLKTYFMATAEGSKPAASEVTQMHKGIGTRKYEVDREEIVSLIKLFRGPVQDYDPRWYYPYLKEYSGRDLPWQEGPYGLANPSKPYFTPWTPRTYLAPFAIVPWHLEISYLTCQAVYLRDPVTRQDHSEVISPLPLPYHENAFLFYVGNRR